MLEFFWERTVGIVGPRAGFVNDANWTVPPRGLHAPRLTGISKQRFVRHALDLEMKRCPNCRRVFGEVAGHCPECGWRTPLTKIGIILKVLSIVTGVLLLAFALFLVWQQPAKL